MGWGGNSLSFMLCRVKSSVRSQLKDDGEGKGFKTRVSFQN